MRISSIPQIYRNVNRWGEILSILSKYGLAGWLSRFGFDIGKSLLKNRNGQVLAREKRSTRLRLALEELGPTFIKFGQIISTRPDLVGSEVAQELEKLQTNVPNDPPELVSAFVEQELGRPIDQIFSQFSQKPVASASIGQVHRARLHSGEDVAVKIQHHGIRQRVRVDLEILTGLADLAERLPELQCYRPRATVAEFKRALRRELDFCREFRNMQQFAKALEANERIRIPQVYPDFCTESILVMQWLEGIPFSEVDKQKYAETQLSDVAHVGAEMYMEMIFHEGLYQGDPHPGNFLLMKDLSIGLLDFGMIIRLEDSLREAIEDMLLAIVEQDAEQLVTVVTRIGSLPPGFDETNLGLDLADYVSHYAYQSIDQFQLADALSELFELISRYQIILPSPVALLLKVFIMLEGTAKKLQPDFNIMEVLAPYQRKIASRRMSPRRQLRKARRLAFEMQQLIEILPRRMHDILQQVQSGSFEVQLDHRGLEPSVNRLVLGMLTSALFLGSVLLLTNEVWPIRSVSVPGFLGVGLSLVLGLRLLRAINKSGHLDSHDPLDRRK